MYRPLAHHSHAMASGLRSIDDFDRGLMSGLNSYMNIGRIDLASGGLASTGIKHYADAGLVDLDEVIVSSKKGKETGVTGGDSNDYASGFDTSRFLSPLGGKQFGAVDYSDEGNTSENLGSGIFNLPDELKDSPEISGAIADYVNQYAANKGDAAFSTGSRDTSTLPFSVNHPWLAKIERAFPGLVATLLLGPLGGELAKKLNLGDKLVSAVDKWTSKTGTDTGATSSPSRIGPGPTTGTGSGYAGFLGAGSGARSSGTSGPGIGFQQREVVDERLVNAGGGQLPVDSGNRSSGDGGGSTGGSGAFNIPLPGPFRSAYDPMYTASNEQFTGSGQDQLRQYMSAVNRSFQPGPITPYKFETAPERTATPQGIATVTPAISRISNEYAIPWRGDDQAGLNTFNRRMKIPTQIFAGTTRAFAQGGMAHGGLDSFYKAGGKLLRGDGDGMSDSIPAVIQGDEPQCAALADGEFVIPADVVSHLGNGSTDAGAKKLYAMMDRIRQARTGSTEQAPEIDADKYMPKA